MMNLNISGLLFSAIFILFQNTALAGVQISNTRIIYPGDVDEVQATVKTRVMVISLFRHGLITSIRMIKVSLLLLLLLRYLN